MAGGPGGVIIHIYFWSSKILDSMADGMVIYIAKMRTALILWSTWTHSVILAWLEQVSLTTVRENAEFCTLRCCWTNHSSSLTLSPSALSVSPLFTHTVSENRVPVGMQCTESRLFQCNNRKGKEDKSKCPLPVSLLRANGWQGCLSSPSFRVMVIYFWMQCLGHLCRQLGILPSSAARHLDKMITEDIFYIIFHYLNFHTIQHLLLERNVIPSPHSGGSEAGRGRESLQPDCTPSCTDLQLAAMLVTRHKIQENNLTFIMGVFLRTTWDVHLSAFWKVLEFSQTIRLRMCWR